MEVDAAVVATEFGTTYVVAIEASAFAETVAMVGFLQLMFCPSAPQQSQVWRVRLKVMSG